MGFIHKRVVILYGTFLDKSKATIEERYIAVSDAAQKFKDIVKDAVLPTTHDLEKEGMNAEDFPDTLIHEPENAPPGAVLLLDGVQRTRIQAHRPHG